MKKKTKYALLTIVFGVLFAFQSFILFTPPKGAIDVETMEIVPYATFESDIEGESVSIVYFSDNISDVYVKKTDNSYYKTTNPEYDTFKKDLLDAGLTVQSVNEFLNEQKPKMSGIATILYIANMMLTSSLAMRWAYASLLDKASNPAFAQPSGGTKDSGTKTESKEKNAKRFQDIAGLYEVKKDMQCLVDFLKNKDKYTEAGATLPKGVIFYGPPGTGKTLLAKAVAGEADVPFHYMSGSDFVEMYVGTGAKRVRELFATAKRKTPCIVFIDEIDAIGGRRTNDINGEDRKTLNALLTEMDGFKATENVLVIAATNRLEDLDPALVRPGRFTNKFCVPLPETAKERLEIIKLYGKNKKFAEDVNFDALAKETMGFSPASIEALLNEAAIISVQDGKKFIDKETIDKAMFKILLSGHVKENQSERSKEELKLVAWHEAGHALIGKLNGKSIPKVTILSTTSGAGGVTFTTPKQIGMHSVDDLKAEVSELYAGRVAELMLLKDKNKVTTGASNDIQKATDIIKGIVTSYGMSDEFGMLNLNQLQVSQDEIIAQEVKMAKEIEDKTIAILTEHYETLKSIAEGLLENETLYEQDLDRIINKKQTTIVDSAQDCAQKDKNKREKARKEQKMDVRSERKKILQKIFQKRVVAKS